MILNTMNIAEIKSDNFYSSFRENSDGVFPNNDFIMSLDAVGLQKLRVLNSRCQQGDTILHRFHKRYPLETLQHLLENGYSPHNVDMFGCTPLFYASSLEYVKLLVRYGADINHKNLYGSTPLFYHKTDQSIVEYLLEHGADPNHMDDLGNHYNNERKISEIKDAESYEKLLKQYWELHEDDIC